MAITDDEFVVHQFHSGDPSPGIAQRLDKRAISRGRGILTGSDVRPKRFVAVETDADLHAGVRALVQRDAKSILQRITEPHVVDSEIKTPSRAAEKRGQPLHDGVRRLLSLSKKENRQRVQEGDK